MAAFNQFKVLEMSADPPYWSQQLTRWTELYGEDRVLAFTLTDGDTWPPGVFDLAKRLEALDVPNDAGYRAASAALRSDGPGAVSYTHLTLPTKRIV